MEQHYSAFISYKHAPLDIEIAKEVQFRLEHFHIPAVMAKKLGRKKVGRVFRDQEELPITMDLSLDINRALEDADFLIVICSKSTRLSTWVPREIETFLQNHDQSHVLTVLAEGEPAEVIPEILLRARDGTGKELEPLSCDYRGNRRAARKTEIPRLAAALLGCSYDELVMRERQYRRKRFAIAGSAAGILAAASISYLIWSNTQIRKNYNLAQENYRRAEENYQLAEENRQLAEENYQTAQENYEQSQENYRQALMNQSEYLAHEALRVLQTGDRTLAVQLALAALPLEVPERPLSSAAQYALSEALRTCLPEVNVSTDTTAVWSYHTRAAIKSYVLGADGTCFYASDHGGVLYGWDILERAPLFTVSMGGTAIERVFTDQNGNLFVQQKNLLTAVDPRSGEIRWTHPVEAGGTSGDAGDGTSVYYVDDSAFYPSAEGILCLCSEKRTVYQADFSSAEYSFFRVCVLSPADGTLLRDSGWMDFETPCTAFRDFALSRDGALAAVDVYCSAYEDGRAGLLVLDLNALTARLLIPEQRLFDLQGLWFSEDGSALYYYGPLYGEDGSVPEGGYNLQGLEMLEPADYGVVCLELSELRPRWETSFRSAQLNLIDPLSSAMLLSPGESDPEGPRLYSVIYGPTLYSFDAADGRLISEISFSSPIVGYAPHSAKTSSVVFHLHSGKLGMAYPDQGTGAVVDLSSFDAEFDSVLHAVFRGGYAMLAKTDGHTVTQIASMHDDRFTAFSDQDRASEYPGSYFLMEDYLLEQERTPAVNVYSLAEDRQICRFDLSDSFASYNTIRFLGADAAGTCVWFWGQDSSYRSRLYQVDLAAAEVSELNTDGLPVDAKSSCFLCCGGTLLLAERSNGSRLIPLRLEDEVLTAAEEIPLPEGYGYDFTRSMVHAGHILIPVKGDDPERCLLLLVEPETGTVREYDFPGAELPVFFSMNAAGDGFAVGTETRIAVFDLDDGVRFTREISLGRYFGLAFHTSPETGTEQLLVVQYGGSFDGVTGLSPETGDVTTSLRVDFGSYPGDTVNWLFDENTLYLCFGRFYHTWILDLEQSAVRAYVPYCGGWDRPRDRMLTIRPNGSAADLLGWYPHYTWQELAEMAQEYLNGSELEDSTRAQYGLLRENP